MLIKKELATLPEPKYPKGKDPHDFRATAQKVKLPRSGEILVVDFFKRSSRKFILRFFSDGKNFISCQEWPADTWRENSPNGLIGYATVGGSDEDLQMANEFLNQRSWDLNSTVHHFCAERRSEARDKAEHSRNELQKQHFAMFPDLPGNIEEYCNEQVFDHAYVFFSKKDRKGKRDAFCSHCRKHFEAPADAKSGRPTTCPECGARAVYRAMWFKADVVDKAKICITAKVDGQLLIRWSKVIRTYTGPEFEQKYKIDDYAYNLHLPTPAGDKTYFYKLMPIPYYYTTDWYRGHLGDYCYDSTYIYTDNLDEVFGDRYYNVNLKAALQGTHREIAFATLLNNLKHKPVAEYLFKLGLHTMAANVGGLQYDLKGQKPSFSTVLGVSKQFLPMYRAMDIDHSEHRVIKGYGKWVTREEMEAYRKLGVQGYNTDLVLELLQTMSFGRFVRYFSKQKELHPKVTAAHIMTQYRDYLSMSKSFHIDLSHKSVRFPDDCMAAHAVLVERQNKIIAEREQMEFQEAVKALYDGLSIREYERSGFCIVLPQERADFIKEGQSLNHCVGSPHYYKNHIAGTKMIFFVRKVEDREKPFFTMEVDMSDFKIRQLYGFGDCSAPKEVRRFAEEFTKKLAMPAAANRRAS